ncbi:MAG TPA: hypothetical protein VKB48_13655 [Candidatus Acidoferrum sp.]|nr:hypothetical protein [Candidatus Acidoferrum sp.]
MASGAPMGGLDASSADDRAMAMLAHRLMAFTGFIGPVVIPFAAGVIWRSTGSTRTAARGLPIQCFASGCCRGTNDEEGKNNPPGNPIAGKKNPHTPNCVWGFW